MSVTPTSLNPILTPVTVARVQNALLTESPNGAYVTFVPVPGGHHHETRASDAFANLSHVQSAAQKAFARGESDLGNVLNHIGHRLASGDRRIDADGDGKIYINAGYGGSAITDLHNLAKSGSDINNTANFDNSDFGITTQMPVNPSLPSLPNTGIDPNTLLQLLLSGQQGQIGLQNPYGNTGMMPTYNNQFSQYLPQPNHCGKGRGIGHWMRNRFSGLGNINIINNFFGKKHCPPTGFNTPFASSMIAPQIQYPGVPTTGFSGW